MAQEGTVDGFAGFGLGGGATGEEEVGQPEGETVDEGGRCRGGQPFELAGQVERLLDQPPGGGGDPGGGRCVRRAISPSWPWAVAT